MKIRILSDLHFDINYPTEPAPELLDAQIGADGQDTLTLIAGDISGSLSDTKLFLQKYFKKVIFVGGNHIVYNHEGKSLQQLQSEYREEFPKNANITYLENDCKAIGDTVFIGATLWTDYEYGGDQLLNMMHAQKLMNDFKLGNYEEKGKLEPLRPEHCRQMFFNSMSYITNAYDKFSASGMNMVLLTHTGFAPGAISEKFKDSPILSSYVNSPAISDFIAETMPKLNLIIHGHVHHRSRYHIGNIPVICNPLGYIPYGEDKEEPEFDKSLIVDLNELPAAKER